jgi:hypothetical protein
MRHWALLAWLLAAGLALGGCGERPQSADETVFKDQVRALERARTVEEQAEERKRELDRQIEGDVDPGY